MKKFKEVFGRVLVVLMILCPIGMLLVFNTLAVAASDVIKWRCEAHWPTSSTSYSAGAQVVIDKIKKGTNGKLDIELFPGGALVPAKEIFETVKRGMLEMGFSPAAYFRSQVPLGSIASGLPFNFQDVSEAAYFVKWMGFEEMMRNACAKQGVYYACERAETVELVLKKPVRKMEDFKGMKLRSMGVTQIYLTSIGAAASYIPGSELYAALTSGVVDGAHWGAVQGANSMKLYDVCRYHLALPITIYNSDSILVNQKALDKLPKNIQTVVYSVLKEHFWERTNQYRILEGVERAKVEKKGIEFITFSKEEYLKMQKAALKVWDDIARESPECAKAVVMVKDLNRSLGRLQ